MEGIPLTLKDLVSPPPLMPWREFKLDSHE